MASALLGTRLKVDKIQDAPLSALATGEELTLASHREYERGTGMILDRSEMMEKARAKRRRHLTKKRITRRRKSHQANQESLTDKMIDLAQGAVAQVGAVAKLAVKTITL
jgi:hypothetical protein